MRCSGRHISRASSERRRRHRSSGGATQFSAARPRPRLSSSASAPLRLGCRLHARCRARPACSGSRCFLPWEFRVQAVMDRRQADAYGPLLPAELAPASALSKRGIALSMQLQFMRAAEKFAAAAGAARDALRGGSDCLVVASARAHQAIALVCYAREPGVTPAARAAVSRQICSARPEAKARASKSSYGTKPLSRCAAAVAAAPATPNASARRGMRSAASASREMRRAARGQRERRTALGSAPKALGATTSAPPGKER